jgi:hypothetical protein
MAAADAGEADLCLAFPHLAITDSACLSASVHEPSGCSSSRAIVQCQTMGYGRESLTAHVVQQREWNERCQAQQEH